MNVKEPDKQLTGVRYTFLADETTKFPPRILVDFKGKKDEVHMFYPSSCKYWPNAIFHVCNLSKGSHFLMLSMIVQ